MYNANQSEPFLLYILYFTDTLCSVTHIKPLGVIEFHARAQSKIQLESFNHSLSLSEECKIYKEQLNLNVRTQRKIELL